MQFCDLKRQRLRYQEAIDAGIQRVLEHSRFILGPEVQELEEALAAYVGVKHCISVANGTEALELGLMALGVGPGDEVITVPFTFISTAQSVRLVGAKPVFIDIEPKTFNMDVEQLEAAITSRTKAIIPVSLFGQMANLEEVKAIAAKHGIPVMEDGAQSFGATRHGKRSCGLTTLAMTSFFPSKPLGCYGDGGALFTDDDALAEILLKVRVHGAERRNHYTCAGMNSRLDSMQAAILLAKWPHFDEEIESRQRIGERYDALLGEFCATPAVEVGNTHVYAQYTIRVPNRDEVIGSLEERKIPYAVHYSVCLHEQPAFADLGYEKGAFPVAEQAAAEVLSLPMHPFLKEEEQDQIVEAVRVSQAASV